MGIEKGSYLTRAQKSEEDEAAEKLDSIIVQKEYVWQYPKSLRRFHK